MIRNIFWLNLALSLLFNIFFAAGYMQARAQAERADRSNGIPQLVAEELNLDDAQAALFSRLRSSMKDEAAVIEDAIALGQQELVDELGKETPDLDGVRALVARSADLHQQRRAAGAERFSQFLSALTPEQCRMMSRKLHHGRWKGRSFRMLERFDADGDGALNDEERAAAQEFIDARRRERDQRRSELHERFDEDQDGQLDPQERKAMWEWMRSQPGRGHRR